MELKISPHQELYCCKCDYTAKRVSDFKKHLKTNKHLKDPNEKKVFNCVCGKEYGYASSLYKHKKKCTSRVQPDAVKIMNLDLEQMKNIGIQKDNILTLLRKENTNKSDYEYDMDDPIIMALYMKIKNKIQQEFVIDNDVIIFENKELMTQDDIDSNNLKIVNELLNIIHEQQQALHECLIVENMDMDNYEDKYKYYVNAVKKIVFLYGEEIQKINLILIAGLRLHEG